MQQTENYKLNLIETSDTFSPVPLNENAEKTETALTSVTGRVTVLEAGQLRLAVGSYVGDNSASKSFQLGFTPKVVLMRSQRVNYLYSVMAVTDVPCVENNTTVVEIVEGGFVVIRGSNDWNLLSQGTVFLFTALG